MWGCSKRSQVIFFIVIVSAVLTLLTDKGRQPTLDELSIFLGWSYFTCWSVSFYPQVLLNHRRKSVVGLSLDFLLLNFVGFLSYTVYNLGKYNSELDHGGVQLNDIVFSIHAFVLTTVCGIQCCIYRRPEQRVAIATRAMVFLAALGALLFGILVPISRESGVWTFPNFLTYVGCIKLAVTLIKYTPQAWLNYTRKSTDGWTIDNVLLDISGGMLSFGQLIVDVARARSWSAVVDNPVKVGLSLVSIGFDVLFICQHYVLYPEKRALKEKHDVAVLDEQKEWLMEEWV